MNHALSQVQRALALIERTLFEPLPLARVSRAAGCSPFHFHRVFSAVTGETPASYIRKRRFSELCMRLVQSSVPMSELALYAGYESQASFTRAFTRHIGVSPGRYRAAKLVRPAHRYPKIDAAELAARHGRTNMEPRIEHRPAFHVIGMSVQFSPTGDARLGELWERFNPRVGEIRHRRNESRSTTGASTKRRGAVRSTSTCRSWRLPATRSECALRKLR